MALVLTLRKGQDFFVGENQFTVDEIKDEANFTLKDKNGKVFQIGDNMSKEVADDVFISSGDYQPLARIAIDAPHEVPIHRGDKRRGQKGR